MKSASHPDTALRLHSLPIGQWGTVLRVLPAENGQEDPLMLRLLEIGFVPGEPVRVMAAGQPGHEPLAVRVGHTTFGLRRHEAERVCVAAGAQHD